MGKLFQDLKALKKEYDARVKKEGRAALKEAFKELFDKYPEIDSIIWTQFTPYFNDGEECRFSVHGFDVSLKEFPADLDEDVKAELEEYQDEDGDYGGYSYGESLCSLKKSNNARLKEIANAVSELEREIPDDVLKDVFGDHCKVVATRNGFSVDSFEHE